MLDLYTCGESRRVSPEAPVLVLNADRQEARLGGAGAVVSLAAALGAEPLLCSVVGNDSAGSRVRELGDDLVPQAPRKCRDESSLRSPGDELPSPSRVEDGLPSPSHNNGDGLGRPSSREGRGEGGMNRSVPGATPSSSIILDPDRPTTVKERLVGRTSGRHGQQILRVDRESRVPVSGEVEAQLRASALAALDRVGAVLISDYGKGVCTSELLAALIGAARDRAIPVLVDPRRADDYEAYCGATLIKPNRHAAGQATGREIGTIDDAFEAGRDLCAQCGCHAAVVTLDAAGMVLVTRDGTKRHFATRDRQVADVTGAGDTVLAVLGTALAAGMDLEHACELANAAAGLQVERVGVSALTWDEINSVANGLGRLSRCEDGLPSPSCLEDGLPSPSHNNGDGLGRPSSREGGLHRIRAPSRPANGNSNRPTANVHFAIDAHRNCGQRIVFTNGCFDLLHAGHVHSLIAAKTMGNVLVVGLNSDASVRRLKGSSRPIVAQGHRAAMLAALACVDYVVIFDEDTPERLIAELRPDVLVKGGELPPERIPGASLVASYGGRVERVPLLGGISTTALMERIRAASPTKCSDVLLPLPLGEGRGEGVQNCPTLSTSPS